MAGDSVQMQSRSSSYIVVFICFSFLCNCVLMRPCVMEDFGHLLLPCNSNRTRSIVPFLTKKCDPTKNGSYFPQPVEGLPCECNAGQGIKIETKRTAFTWKCEACKPGNYSSGGWLIDTWERWNGTMKIPGSGYRFTPYCTSITGDESCNGWQPSDDFSHLVSNKFVNATNPVTCYHKKSMQTYVTFYKEDLKSNWISFRYKVDGMPCPKRYKSRSSCRKGLRFYIDEKLVLHSDAQFTWRVFKYNLTKGTHLFRWAHVSSCSQRDGFLDVGYVTHVSFIGGQKPPTVCKPCPPGTYSNKEGSTECIKCPYGQYQNKSGQSSCLKCPAGQFSHEADKGCFSLRKCQYADYRVRLDPVSKCKKINGKLIRNARLSVPKWPGMNTGPCIPDAGFTDNTLTPKPCYCPLGYRLVLNHGNEGYPDSYECVPCPTGLVSNGNTSYCSSCPDGNAAIPGLFYNEWIDGLLPKQFKTECAGKSCSKDGGWLPNGNRLTTNRIPGNFETYLELGNLQIDYYKAFVRFQCSVDCRINPSTNNFASSSDCQLRFSIVRDNSIVVREVDCVKYGRDHLRNGTVMSHYYSLPTNGNYTLRWLFVQNDDENTNVLSYKASIHSVSVLGVKGGKAPKCRSCLAGSMVKGSSCVKCPVGHFSSDGKGCKKCPENYFQDEIGRSSCIPCGANTKSNADRTGCLINECKFEAAPGVLYDLMPLANDGGPMTQVQQPPRTSGHPWYRKYYYVNLCTLNHDNTSCTDLKSRRTESGLYVRESVILKTMACKRWSLSSRYSYSLGRVIGFKKIANIREGLTIELTDGYSCYNRFAQKMQSARTVIQMQCDVNAGLGVPMPKRNDSGVEVESCVFHLVWNSLYACPVCKHVDFKEVHTDCIRGFKNVTYLPLGTCRNSTRVQQKYSKNFVPCQTNKVEAQKSKAVAHTGLIVIVIIFILVAISLIVTVIMLLRKNRMYRAQLFSPGTHMKQLRDDDLHELIDD